MAYTFTVRLYNALALEVPNLPGHEDVLFRPALAALTVIALFISSTGLTLLAVRWIGRQSSLALLEEGM